MMKLRAEPLTAEGFEPFGEVIETAGRQPERINRGTSEKFSDLLTLVAGEGGRPAVHLYRVKPARQPIEVSLLERHRLGSQAFIPLHKRPFPVVVAAPDAERSTKSLRAFLSNGRQGVNLRPGTWHHALLCLEQASDFLVIDRHASEPDCEEWTLDEALLIELPPHA